VTSEVLRRPDGRLVRWRSRAHRKRAHAHGERRGVWWRPDRVSWWMGLLFAVGSICFAVASIAAQWSSASETAIDVTFFAGSLFFTTAAYLQYAETVNVPHRPQQAARRRRLRPASWEPRRIDWLAAAVQLAGTVLFNISTFAAMRHGLSTHQVNRRVWAPDAFGSACFLLASMLAYAEVCHRWSCFKPRSLSWRIVALNLIGSIAFGAAAVASLVAPSTGLPVSARIANAGTAAGALCFLAGAVLLAPEAASPDRDDAAPPRPA
jgi:YrhK-like protein